MAMQEEREVACGRCEGYGEHVTPTYERTIRSICPRCHGTGVLRAWYSTEDGRSWTLMEPQP
ncbi:hypothetical protein GCM10017673_56150 [Streptosporangium violaceochromogenes]|nr:hypothetical protein GCM10017673_56150 [Streptosporangium violaceochromogenes]